MRTGIFVSGRNKSTRLPRKLFLPMGDETTLDFLMRRLALSAEADVLSITTSDHEDDQVFAEVAQRHNAECFFGAQDDKLARYRDAMAHYELDYAVVVDADDILVGGDVVDRIIVANKNSPAAFTIADNLPLGLTGFGISREGLAHVVSKIDAQDTEIWGHYFTQDPDLQCRMLPANADEKFPGYRLTMDYESDYAVMRTIGEVLSDWSKNLPLASANLEFSPANICAYLEDNPELANRNASVQAEWEIHKKKQLQRQKVS